MLEEELNFEGVDEICGAIEDLSSIEEIIDLPFTSISAPLM